MNGRDGVVVEKALRVPMRLASFTAGKETSYPFIDSGIPAESEVKPYDVTRRKPNNDVQSVRARSDLRDGVACRDLRKCHPSKRFLLRC